VAVTKNTKSNENHCRRRNFCLSIRFVCENYILRNSAARPKLPRRNVSHIITGMKCRIAILVLIVLSQTAIAYSQSSSDAVQLTGLLSVFLSGASVNDVAVHDRFWADDLIYTRSAGVRTNKAELMKGVRSAPPRQATDPKTVYTAEDIQIHQYGDTAVVAFRLVATTTKQGATEVSNYLNTGTFVKRRGEWRAVAWQSTVMAKPAPE